MKRVFKVIAALACIVVLVSVANAQIPHEINYQGLIADKETGESIEGPVTLTFRLFDWLDCDTGTQPDALWSETHTGVVLDNGIFSVLLGSVTAFPDSLIFNEQYCLGIEVDGEELLPRQPLSSVAYSLNSLRADTALTVLEFPSHDHNDLYYTESELNTAGTLNDSANPVDWTMLKNVPADFADGIDNTAAGGFLEVLAGEGLSEEVAGDTKILSVTPGGIQETMLADSAVTGEKIRSNSITSAQIAGGAVTAGEIASGTITSAQIAPSTITAAEISGNTITAAQISPAAITANEIFGNTLTADQLATAAVDSDELADSSVTTDKIAPDAVTTAEIADGTILLGDIGQNGASAGQIMTWSGSAWVAGDDSEGGVGDITSVTAGTGLSGGGDTLDVSLAVDFAGTGAVDSVARSDHDHDDDYVNEGQPGSVDSSMILDGSVISADILDGALAFGDIGQNGAAAGQVMKWNGAAWAAANDSVGAGGSGSGGWTDDGTVVRLEAGVDSVGIGTTTPTEKLDVVGNLRVSGTAVIGSGHNINPGTGMNLAGENHDADGDFLVISGGLDNTANGQYASVGGGRDNTAGSEYSTVGGGRYNQAEGRFSVVAGGGSEGGGDENRALGDYATIGGGRNNRAGDLLGPWEDYAYATVSGGQNNRADGRYCTVGGGWDNRAEDEYATVGGGMNNQAEGRSTVGGGSQNQALNGNSTVGGGMDNMANNGGTVGGGSNNIAGGDQSTIPGGRENEATESGTFAAGTQARARHEGSFVMAASWPSSGDDTISTGGDEQFVIRADGGIYLTNTSEQAPYDVSRLINTSTGAWLSTAGQWRDSSDRNLKENFEPVDGGELLEKIAGLPVTQWNYKVEGDNIKHIGPVAQDFYGMLGIGNDDRTIAALDEAGVSLAAIQQLYLRSKSQESEIEGLKDEIRELKKLVRILAEKE